MLEMLRTVTKPGSLGVRFSSKNRTKELKNKH